jgi:hypothetical protein
MDRIPDGQRRDLAIPPAEIEMRAVISKSAIAGSDPGRGKTKGKAQMDAKRDLKAKLPSRHVTEGPERAPHRSYYYAMGLTREQIHQPFVGVATCWNEAAPSNI